MDISPTILTLCGVTCSCGLVIGIAGFMLTRVMGKSMIFPILTAGGGLFGMLFNRGDNDGEEDIDKYLSNRRNKRKNKATGVEGDPNTAFTAQAQSADLDFDSQVQQRINQKGGGRFSSPQEQGGAPTPLSPQSQDFTPAQHNVPQSGLGRRFTSDDNDPLGDNSESTFGDDLGSLPEDLGSLRDRRRRGSSRRGRDSNAHDDEVFGGMLDEDGDGFSDF